MEQQSQSTSEPQLDSNSFQHESDENSPESQTSQVYLGSEDGPPTEAGPGVVKVIHKLKASKKKYHTINDDNRKKLIDAVENRGEKIKHAAKRLNINYSSAKSICQVFKKEGRTDKKTFKRRGGKDDFIEDINSRPILTASVTSLHNLEFGNDGMQAGETMSFSEEPEKDTLKILRDRLLESRASRLKHLYQSDQELTKKENTPRGKHSNPMFNQLQQLDDVIAQNNKLLGESPETWKKSFLSESSSLSNLRSQATLSPVQNSIEIAQNEASQMGNNFDITQQNGQNGFPKQMLNVNPSQARNIGIQNFSAVENNLNQMSHQSIQQQQNPIYSQSFTTNNQQQVFLFPPQGLNNNGNQSLNMISNMSPNLMNGQQANGFPVLYMIPQQNNMQVSPSHVLSNGTTYFSSQAGLSQLRENNNIGNTNNILKQNFSLFQNPYTLNELQNQGKFLNMQDNSRQNH